MLSQVRKTIEAHSMLARGDHLLVAVSGGADSVSLLRVLARLAGEYRLRLTTAHLNHRLRGAESDREELFVRRLSDQMGFDCIRETIDIASIAGGRGGSLEEAAREERYRFLLDAAARCGAIRIATGHHRDDQVETILMNLLRGSGPQGLKGIHPVRAGRIIRPLLDVGRMEILDFLRQEGVGFVTDSSNHDPAFLRNRIRAELIPDLIAHYNPRLAATLCQTAEILRREDDYLEQVVRQLLADWKIARGAAEKAIPLDALRTLHGALQARIVKSLLEAAAPAGNGIGYRHIEAVLALSNDSDGRYAFLDLPFGIRAERETGLLRIRRGEEPRSGGRRKNTTPPPFEYRVSVPTTLHIREIDRTVRLEWIAKPTFREISAAPRTGFIDYRCVEPPLILRSPRPGERIDLLGRGGPQKLNEYLINRKIPRPLRSRIPLLADRRSVIWVAGERIAQRVRVTEQTQRVLMAEMV